MDVPTARPFHTLMVANRGEIACRIIRSAERVCGLRTVAVYSEADRDAPHVHAAQRAVCLGPPSAADSYMNIEALMCACDLTGAEAIHPGYGFLSERAALARACAERGLIFVGPARRRHRGDGLEDRRQGPHDRSRPCRACPATTARSRTTTG